MCNLLLFEKFSSFLHRLEHWKSGFNTLDHYLDDFVFAGADCTNNCETLMGIFSEVSQELGIPLAENKTVGPITCITVLGLGIDTEHMMYGRSPCTRGRLLHMRERKRVFFPALFVFSSFSMGVWTRSGFFLLH